ncbi:MAG: recA protein [Bdellovibrionota bacterium]
MQKLKLALATHLREEGNLKRPDGIETGFQELDRFLFWHGIPKGALTSFNGALGTGATSLWIEAAAKTLAAGKWVVWINRDVPLSPLPLQHKGMNLGHFVSIEAPEDSEKLFWLLQELMSAQLFDLVGCDLGQLNLKEHQLRKLQAQARTSNAALVFLSQQDARLRLPSRRVYRLRGSIASLFSLIVNFERKRIVIERALHRQTPHTFTRSVTYARFTHATSDRIGFGSPDTGQLREPSDHSQPEPGALPQAPGPSAVGL